MSASLLRGLRVLEMLGTEPLGVSEIARRLGVDKAGVSRSMRDLLAEGWVERTGASYVLGARALRLGFSGQEPGLLGAATRLTERLREMTGHCAVVLQLRRSRAQPLAVAEAPAEAGFRERPEPFEHLWGTAGGLALLAQLEDSQVAPHLELDPWPRVTERAPADPATVWQLIRDARAGQPVEERSWTLPGLACLALPWRGCPSPLPVSVAVLGPEEMLLRDRSSLVAAIREALAGELTDRRGAATSASP